MEEREGDDELEPLIQIVECRICQEEDSIKNLETPCACSGSLKVSHLSQICAVLCLIYLLANLGQLSSSMSYYEKEKKGSIYEFLCEHHIQTFQLILVQVESGKQ